MSSKIFVGRPYFRIIGLPITNEGNATRLLSLACTWVLIVAIQFVQRLSLPERDIWFARERNKAVDQAQNKTQL
ncbi:hypothetical protein, partial [Stenotrophomonas maltophilia]|uniref:hypothetical protein n=1 Tax=Stenotrophomonas maltophilia TaxID=40324 RepID=UPI001954006F